MTPESGLDERVARLEGRVEGFDDRFDGLERRLDGVELADALVAAAAATLGLRLWTLNRKQYPMEDVRFFEPR